MKKFLLLVLVTCFLMSTTGEMNTSTATTVAQIKSIGQDYDHVNLKGAMIAQIDDDEYMFEDMTDSIRVELQDKAAHVVYAFGRSLEGVEVEIMGFLDKRNDHPLKVNVHQIDIVGTE